MGKLVRDKIVDIMEADGKKVKSHQVSDRNELIKALLDKLHEEVDELTQAWEETNELNTEEIIDIEEVLDKIKVESKLSLVEIKAKKEYKAIERGTFDLGIILDDVK